MADIQDILRVRIVSEGWDNLKRKISEVRNEMKGYKQGTEIIKDRMEVLTNQLNHFNNRMQTGTISSQRYSKEIARIHRNMDMLQGSITKTTRKTDQFHAEFLSLMFFGMAMSSAMQGLLNPAMQAFGVMDIWSSALTVTFMPIMELLLPILLWLTDILMDMPEPLQLVVGGFVLAGAVIGKLLTFIGMLALAFFGFVKFAKEFPATMKLFSPLGNIFKFLWVVIQSVVRGIIATITGMSATMLAVIVGLLLFLWLAWTRNWGNIREHFDKWINGIVDMARGIKDMLLGAFLMVLGAVKALFTGDTDVLKRGWEKFIDGLGTYIHGLWTWISEPFNWIIDLVRDAFNWIVKVLNKVKDLGANGTLKAISNKIGKGIGGGIDYIANLIPMATGGLVTRPTPALIGEAGPEAVIPLDKLGSMGNTININNPNVRNEQDIRTIAEQVGRVLENNRRRFR